MAWGKKDKPKSNYAMNMSLRQQARRAAAEGVRSDAPKNFAELEPKGPLGVKNQVVGRLIQNGDAGDVYPDQAFRDTNFGVIHISKENLNGAPYKMTVVCEVLNPDNQNKDFRVYTLLGDGEIEEGEVWEAAMFAGAKKLDNLCVIVDNNNLQIDGTVTEVNNPYPIDRKFEAFNFHVINIDGHDFDQIRAAFREARETKGMPTAIIAKTVKGKGVSFMENQVSWHGTAPNDEQYAQAMKDLERIGETI